MLDANANRAREAMRVMEDAARFALNDRPLSERLKVMRHALRDALENVPAGVVEANRDAAADVGAPHSTSGEMSRQGLLDIVIAAGKRLSESLRVLEEALKTIDRNAAAAVKQLRYQGYDADAALQMRFGAGRPAQWRLCLLLTQALCRDGDWRATLEQAIAGGIDCVQVREKQLDDAALAAHVRQVVQVAREGGRRSVSVIVNDRADIALICGADGVHLGQCDLSVQDVRRIAGRTLLIGVSTHDMNEAKIAVEAGADYCGVGAMFASALKPGRSPSGLGYLKQFRAAFPDVAHLAIGGITAANAGEVAAAGAKGIAASTAICGADDPESVAQALRAPFESAADLLLSDGSAVRSASL